jgi:hypothetical protein
VIPRRNLSLEQQLYNKKMINIGKDRKTKIMSVTGSGGYIAGYLVICCRWFLMVLGLEFYRRITPARFRSQVHTIESAFAKSISSFRICDSDSTS